MKIEINEFKTWQHSLTIKVLALGVMGIFLLLPLELIKEVIRERQTNSENVKKEIAFQWAGQQTVSGPVLNIPVRFLPARNDAEPYITIYHLMPEALKVSGNVQTEKRHRSIYEAVVYTGFLELSGSFNLGIMNSPADGQILWKDAYYSMGISDNRGLKGDVVLKTDTESLEAIPGLKDNDLFSSGITFNTDLTGSPGLIPFQITFNLSGSESLSFSPVGKKTEINLKSAWPTPGFKGNFLPVDRTINDSGFNANWIVTNLNRNFPQIWPGKSFNPLNDSFGVDFILAVDHYQKSLRSAKYGILFIALTFLALIFAEFTIKDKIHLFQYLLVSMALVLFFSLLNALSEQLGFNAAYLTASIATIGLISAFLKTIIRKISSVFLIAGMLIVLYSFIFILLTLDDYAYLAGNIGLFILLGTTMFLSVRLKLFTSEEKL